MEVFFDAQGVFLPVVIREAESDVVAESIIFEQKCGVTVGMPRFVDEIGAAPSEDFVPALGQDGLEAGGSGPFAEMVIVGKFGAAKGGWRDAEKAFEGVHLLFYLSFEFG